MVITFPDGKTYEGLELGQVMQDGIEITMMNLRPLSKSKYLILRSTDKDYKVQIMTGFESFNRFYSYIEKQCHPQEVVGPLLDAVQKDKHIDWKKFYDDHYPEFVFAGMTWSDFKNTLLERIHNKPMRRFAIA